MLIKSSVGLWVPEVFIFNLYSHMYVYKAYLLQLGVDIVGMDLEFFLYDLTGEKQSTQQK